MAENNLIGTKIKNYKIVERIGQGGNAVVYLARDEKLDRLVAVKMLYAYEHHPRREKIIERFRRGAQAAAQLQHPNILPVYDFGEWEKTFYIVMQYVPDKTLRQYLLGDADMRPVKPLPLSKALDIAHQVGAALIHAHRRGIIHRDVKPSNIILENNHVYLTDFGLAHVEGAVSITQSGETLGTPHYMSPEQGRGLPIDYRSDIYSLAVVLFQMLTGQVPFHAETPMSVILKHMVDPLPPPRSLNPKIPVMIEVVLRKALSKNPSDRQQTVEEFIHQLEQATTHDAPTLVGMPPSYSPQDFGLGVEGDDSSSPRASFIPPMEQAAELPDYSTDTAPLALEKRSRKWIVAAFLGGIVGVLLCGIAIFVLLGGIDLLGGATVTPAQLAALTPTSTAFTPTPTQTRAAIRLESPTLTAAFTSSPTKLPPSATPTLTATPSPASSATLTPLPTKTLTLTPTGTPTPSLTPTSPPLPGGMVLIPAGSFIQGSLDSEIDAAIQMCNNAYGGQCPHPREWFTDETPRRTVYLDAFYIDRWEVTNKQFASFIAATAYQTDAEKKGEAQTWRTFNTTGRENYPAIWTSWNDADAYCTWAGKRLPTEAEWEKAARGDDARIWPWGSNWESGRANTGGSAVAVGSYSTGASPYGVMDMAGNVWEWVADWHDPNWYSNSPLRNPGGPILGVNRVLRGGGFNNPPWEMRAAHRHSGGQDGYAPDHGFRCAK